MNYIVLLSICLTLVLPSFCQKKDQKKILLAEGSYLEVLVVSPDNNHIVFAKGLPGFDDGDYIEGQIFIYDVKTNKSKLISKDTFEISAINVEWSKKGGFYLNDGNNISLVSVSPIINNKVIYKNTNSLKEIRNFSVSNEGDKIAIWYADNSPEEISVSLNLYDLISKKETNLFSLPNDYENEVIPLQIAWGVNDRKIYTIDVEGLLSESNLDSGTKKNIAKKVDNNLLVFKNNILIYQSGNKLIKLDITSNKLETVFDTKGLKVKNIFFNPNLPFYIIFNNKVVSYDIEKKIERVAHLTNGATEINYFNDVMYVKKQYIKERQALYLYK